MGYKNYLHTGVFVLAITGANLSTFAQQNNTDTKTSQLEQKLSRLSLGGYGEAVLSRNFYSDNIYRYTRAQDHKNDDSHGRFDLPHVTINIGYDFGHGWTMGSEIEFEHGGTESAIELDADESGYSLVRYGQMSVGDVIGAGIQKKYGL